MNEVHKLRREDAPDAPWTGVPSATDLASSVASRICHDLASPLGAIANGLELLLLTGLEASPELTLLEESVASAKARVRFFRIAFGAAGRQPVGRAEVLDILGTISKGSRIAYDWAVDGDVSRSAVKAAFLAIQCLETALPVGGQVRVELDGDLWTVSAQSLRLRIDAENWNALDASNGGIVDAASLVQFILLPQAVSDLDRTLSVAIQPDRITCRF